MKIAVSSPDGLGDFILREPLFAGLLAAGHRLLLCTCPVAAQAAPLIAAGAAVLPIDVNPYAPPTARDLRRVGELADAVRAFGPDLLLVAPFQWTWFEERLAALLPDVPTLGLKGGPYPLSVTGLANRPPWTTSIAVATDAHEWEKNRALAVALGVADAWRPPVVCAGATLLGPAQDWLAGHGLRPGGYWLGCIGQTPESESRQWPVERWAALLRQVAAAGLAFVLVGTENEAAVVEQARQLAGVPAEVMIGGLDQFDLLVGLTALSAGYVGRDTGPMHLAAALGRPVFTVMGGGHWPRFLPLTSRARILTQDVPCVGCGYVCHLSRSYCIKDVPAALAEGAFKELLDGGSGNHVVTVPRSPDLARAMECDAAEQGRLRLRLLNDRQACVDELTRAHGRAVGELRRMVAAHENLLMHTQMLQENHERLLEAHQRLAAEANRPTPLKRMLAKGRRAFAGIGQTIRKMAARQPSS